MKPNVGFLLLSVFCAYALEAARGTCWHEFRQEETDQEFVRHAFTDVIAVAKTNHTLVPVLIIGSGPSGLAAAMYAARAKLYTVVVTGEEPLGQLANSKLVENMPAVPADAGHKIMRFMEQTAVHYGAKFLDDSVESIERSESGSFFTVTTTQGKTIHALTVIIATGISPQKMGIPGEDTYLHRGVFTCAICECRLTTDKAVVIGGTGNSFSFAEMISYLLPYAQSIAVVGPQNVITAAVGKQRKGREKITMYSDATISEIVGDGKEVTDARIHTVQGDVQIPTDFVFLALQRVPHTERFAKLVKCDSQGYIELLTRTQATSCSGIFGAGNVADRHYKQASTATGYGAAAGLDAVAYLRKQGFTQEIAQLCEPYYLEQVRSCAREKSEIYSLADVPESVW